MSRIKLNRREEEESNTGLVRFDQFHLIMLLLLLLILSFFWFFFYGFSGASTVAVGDILSQLQARGSYALSLLSNIQLARAGCFLTRPQRVL